MKYLSLISLVILFTVNGWSITQFSDPGEDAFYMLEEERMAMEIYQGFFDKWEHHIFDNISQAEKRHFEIMTELVADMHPDLDLSNGEPIAGVYKNEDLQNLFDNLVRRGSISLMDALKVGAEIEEMNIQDLKWSISKSKSFAPKSTYESLLDASYNHLNAFVRNIEKSGENYKPVLLDKELYESIISKKSKHKKGSKKNCKSKNGDNSCAKSCSGKKGNKNGKSKKCNGDKGKYGHQ